MSDLSYHDILYRAVGEAKWRRQEQEKEAAELAYRQELVDAAVEELKQEQQELIAVNQLAEPSQPQPPQQPQPQSYYQPAPYSSSPETITDHEAQSQQYLREKRQNQRLQQEKQFEMNRELAEAAQALHDQEVALTQEKLRKGLNQQPQQENPLENATTIYEEQ